MMGRILAIDPGEKRIGVAVSDETGTLARGLTVIDHVSIKTDCLEIVKLAREYSAKVLIVGNAVGDEETERPQSRHAQKLAEKLTELSGLPVELWDENGSTRDAQAIRLKAGVGRSKRCGHLDEVAAAVILQSWLDANHEDVNRHA
jgi:putative Holliday junction resolvase